MGPVRQWAWIGVGASVLAFAVMEVALAQRDYTVAYVQKVGSSTTPTLFNVAALWSSLEGSILLWLLTLGAYVAWFLYRYRNDRSDPLVGWALVVMLVVFAFFFLLSVGPAAAFVRAAVPPGFDGPGPNPLLQNHILVAFHPPLLYGGYVGFTVPFAFAIAALITGRLGEGWLVSTRRWTVAAWGMLTVGIVLGAWWSYEVLGWGGFWAWDPVENASLLPWLTGTAYLHSVMVQQQRGLLRVWNLSLLCATFSLTILGTFLTRSGVVQSVHAFADGAVGPFLLVFFAVVAVGSVGLIGWRGQDLARAGTVDSALSREGAFLANNVVFAALAFMVLLGTVFPLLAEAYNDTRLTIGRPYFDSLGRPLGLALLFLMAVGTVVPWGGGGWKILGERLYWPGVAAVGAMSLAVGLGARGLWPVATFGLGGLAGGAAVRHLALAVRRNGWRGFVGRTNGGMVVHLGVVILAVGLAASESYLTDQVAELNVGDSMESGGHTFTYLGAGADENDRRVKVWADVGIDGPDTVYQPAQTLFRRTGQAVATPSVKSGFTTDLYLVLDQTPAPEDDSIRLRVIIRPMVSWLWTGGIIMGVGTGLALIPSRRRNLSETVAVEVAEPEVAT